MPEGVNVIETERRLLLRQTEFLRRQRHDFLNTIQVIKGYIQLGSPEKALACIEETVKTLAPQQEISRIEEELLQALVLQWYFHLTGRGTAVVVRVAEEFTRPLAFFGGERAEAFQAFVDVCDADADTGVGSEDAENLYRAVIELAAAEGKLVCRYSLYREDEPLKQEVFLLGSV
ncbi:MAG: Spo0B domain-containing protein [Gracilibacteraceae bacterium]|nr:Spo0B domain-containing protein [Gracilibacteraceae bacterium]